METWSSAWPNADLEAVAALYCDDSALSAHPFRARERPRDYLAWVFQEQGEAACRFGEPVVAGDRAAVDWWAAITSADGSVETIAGTSLLRFDDDGLVVDQRDAWAAAPGHHELPDWAR